MDEVVELFLAWVPTLADRVFITQAVTRDNYAVRVVNCSRLPVKQKLLIRKRATLFHYANKHLCNIMFSMDEISFGPATPVVVNQEQGENSHAIRSGLRQVPLSRPQLPRIQIPPSAFEQDSRSIQVLVNNNNNSENIQAGQSLE
jgi:hypothetical protein